MQVRFVRIKVPPVVPRLIPIAKGQLKYALVEEVIEANIHSLFPNMRLSQGHLFRVTRDADVEIRDDKAADLLALIKESLRERRFGLPVRLEVSASMPTEMVEYLTASLKIERDDVYKIDGLLDVSDLMELYGINAPELKDKPLKAIVPSALRNKESLFDAIKKQDVLLHHPYSSFGTIVDFIDAAANDPDVVAIKMCLYRTGKKSPIPQALIGASERGKIVGALMLAQNLDPGARLRQMRRHITDIDRDQIHRNATHEWHPCSPNKGGTDMAQGTENPIRIAQAKGRQARCPR